MPALTFSVIMAAFKSASWYQHLRSTPWWQLLHQCHDASSYVSAMMSALTFNVIMPALTFIANMLTLAFIVILEQSILFSVYTNFEALQLLFKACSGAHLSWPTSFERGYQPIRAFLWHVTEVVLLTRAVFRSEDWVSTPLFDRVHSRLLGAFGDLYCIHRHCLSRGTHCACRLLA